MKTRRTILLGTATAALLGGLGWSARGLFGKHYPPTPYDDVLVHLKDRDAAARLGNEVLKDLPNLEPSAAVNTLRSRLGHQSLQQAVDADISTGRLAEAHGWIVPESLALLGALAAKVQPAGN